MLQPDIGKHVYADKAVELAKELGETIEKLNELGCIVSLTAMFNEGDEGITLPRLNGELSVEVGVYKSLTPKERPSP